MKTFIIIIGIIVITLGVFIYQKAYGADDFKQLKADKGDIIYSQENNNTIKYLYKSNKEVRQTTHKGIKEDMNKRTKNAQFFKKETRNGKEVWEGRFYTGQPFYKDGNKWYQTEFATTTKEIFDKEMKVSLWDRLFKQSSAASGDPIYSGAGDGTTTYSGSFDWDTLHDASAGSAFDYTSGYLYYAGTRNYTTGGYITRGFFPIDTSAISADSIITNATFSIRAGDKYNTDNDGDDWLNIVQTDQPDQTALTVNDFNNCGATNNPTEGATRIDIGSINTSGYNIWTLTELTWVKKSGEASNCGATAGWTCLGLREGHDCIDSPIAVNTINSVKFYYSEQADVDYDPYITITYTAGASPSTPTIQGGTIKLNGGTLKID